ncbi:MAG: malate dehydrogenase [Proteobacteria bacterium]|nr:malate dehydrogenase [Pseudomonadota bacterium]MDE3208976.1 malate dehydrogenase [Pseudomonadota bacterium]
MDDLKKRALAYHEFPRPGKISVQPTKPCATSDELTLAYTPGVADAVMEVHHDALNAYRYTNKGNLVAVITNGTAVLGLGNVGALAGKPVMEGKAMLFKRFADIDVFDIEVDTTDVRSFIETVVNIAPTFGGINLEDIKAPECFAIEQELTSRLDIPVFHDDQHGSAVIICAGLMNALEIQGKKLGDVRIVFSGAGAAGSATARLLKVMGARHIMMTDIHGVLHKGRFDEGGLTGDLYEDTSFRTLSEAIAGADVFIGLSAAGVLKPQMLATMNPDPVVFALANPVPEILPDLARATRPDVLMATGRSDFPNQVNNSLCFPYIFRGALNARAKRITQSMLVVAVKAIADLAKEAVPESVLKAYGLTQMHFGKDYILPKQFDPRLLERIAPAVEQAWKDDISQKE